MGAQSAIASRIARVRFARNASFVLFVLLLAGLATAWFSADRVLGWLDRRTDIARDALASALRANHGLDFYASLDERIPTDLATGLPLLGSGAIRVPGIFGAARHFDGRPGENLMAQKQRWAPFARGGFTLTFWARFPENSHAGECRLIWDMDESAGIGLRLSEGLLEVSFGDAMGLHVLSASAPLPDHYVHLALALGTNSAALYVNGRKVDTCKVTPPLALRSHAVAFGTEIHFPPSVDIDEWGVWRCPLSSDEITRLATADRPIPALLEPQGTACLRRRERLATAYRSLLDMLEALRPASSTPAVLNQAIPVLELRLSGSDRRSFRRAHLEALSSGFRTKHGKRSRTIQASYGARSERIAAWLDEMVPALGHSSRPAFVLASENGLFGDGSGLVRLFPPEQWGERRPDAARPLPLDSSLLVRLHLDGDFLGLYCLLPFETPAPPWFATGTRDISRPDRLHFDTPSPVSADGAGLSEAERESAWQRMLALLDCDPGFPLSIPEARQLAKRHAAMHEELRLPDPMPGAASLSRNSALPALYLYFGSPLDKLSRTDFTCRYVPVEQMDAKPEWLSGTGAGHGGAKLRGNTSYVTGRRRSINLKFDALVSFPGLDVPVRHLLLLSGYADPTRLRNALSFETFRAMSPGGPPRSVPVFWAEVFVNGVPTGVWECCPRLQDAVGESFSALYKVRAAGGLWKSPRASAEVVDRVDRHEDSIASPDVFDPYADFRNLARFVVESDSMTFATDAKNVFDLDELADFFLLVNFTGNEDGRITNQYAAQRMDDGRWVLLPWDYDKTFLLPFGDLHTKEELLVSPLFARLFADVPEFRTRVARRWHEFRTGPLRENTLDDWIDTHAALLAPSMDEDYRIVPPLGHDGNFANAIAALRAKVHSHLAFLDHLCTNPDMLADAVARTAASDPALAAPHPAE